MKFSANISTLFSDIVSIGERYAYLVTEYPMKFEAIECQNPYILSLGQWQDIFTKCRASRQPIYLPKWDLINTEPLFRHFDTIPEFSAYHDKILEKALRYAEFFDCPKVHLVMTDLSDKNNITYDTNRVQMLSLLQQAAQFFAQENITCVIEPLSIRDNYYLRSYTDAYHIVKTLGQPNLKILLDIYHMQRLDGNLTANIEAIKDEIGHVQISQVPLRDSPANEGEINYRYVLKLLAKVYKGYVGLEYASETKDTMDWIQDYLHL